MIENKKLLVISYFSPPYGEVGAIRITKFIKYLLRFGWEITVITVKDKYYKSFNYEWLKEVEGAKIIRLNRLPQLTSKIQEEGFYWLPILGKFLNSFLKNEKFKISFWTGNPFYHFLLAPIMKKRFGLKYVLDFRDPWFLSPYRRIKSTFSKISRIYEKIVENIAIKHAEYVINVTDYVTNMYKEYYSNYPSEKFLTIYNGFDPEDLNLLGEGIRFAKFNIVYTGKFTHYRDPIPFLKAFKKFINLRNLKKGDCLFVHVGPIFEELFDYANKIEISSYIKTVGFQPYREALRYVLGADICLLIGGHHPFEPTTKIFEYMAFNKPIIAYVKTEGFITNTLKRYENAYICWDEEDLFNALSNRYNKFLNKKIDIDNGDSFNLKSEFNRITSAQKLSEILEKFL